METETIERIDPGEGHRLLERGEIINIGDEVWMISEREWQQSALAGNPVGDSLTDCTYRRKLTATQPPAPQPVEPKIPVALRNQWHWVKEGGIVDNNDVHWATHNNYISYTNPSLVGEPAPAFKILRRNSVADPNPGEGYRFLKRGEIIRETDEATTDGRWQQWGAHSYAGTPVTNPLLFRRQELKRDANGQIGRAHV